MTSSAKYKVVVLGASAGGMEVIRMLVSSLPVDFSFPLIIVQHLHVFSKTAWANTLGERCQVNVKEANEKEQVKRGTVYFAPANYHLLLESDYTLTLTVDERVNYARPSIDVLFETAAESCNDKVIGILCTGGNTDGVRGLKRIKKRGGMTIVQDPDTAQVRSMPKAAIQTAEPDYILSPEGILNHLLKIHKKQRSHELED
jgi:two-component system chemotaxis response regulator CheB